MGWFTFKTYLEYNQGNAIIISSLNTYTKREKIYPGLDLGALVLSSYLTFLPMKAIGSAKNEIFFPWKALTALILQDGQNGKLSN